MNNDPFSDVRGSSVVSGFGSLHGEGIQQHGDVKVEASPQGRNLHIFCDNCGVPNVVQVDWREIAWLAAGVPPAGWRYDPNTQRLIPHLGCPSCRFMQTPSVTPDEAARWLNAGVSAGSIPKEAAQQLVQQARANAGAMMRR